MCVGWLKSRADPKGRAQQDGARKLEGFNGRRRLESRASQAQVSNKWEEENGVKSKGGMAFLLVLRMSRSLEAILARRPAVQRSHGQPAPNEEDAGREERMLGKRQSRAWHGSVATSR